MGEQGGDGGGCGVGAVEGGRCEIEVEVRDVNSRCGSDCKVGLEGGGADERECVSVDAWKFAIVSQGLQSGKEDISNVVPASYGCADQTLIFFCIVQSKLLDGFLRKPFLVYVTYNWSLGFAGVLVQLQR